MRKKEEYMDLWATAEVLPEWRPVVHKAAERLLAMKDQYSSFAKVDWKLLAVLHMRESGNNFERQILNGEPWDFKTKLIPKGVGPFESWRDSTWYAIVFHGMNGLDFNDMGEVLSFLEAWNGWGYHSRGKQSPYLWSGTQHGEGTGKYVADGRYDADAEDKQIGAATMLLYLMAMENGELEPKIIGFGDADTVEDGPVHKLQEFLISQGATLRGGIDGIFGMATVKAFEAVFGVKPYGT